MFHFRLHYETNPKLNACNRDIVYHEFHNKQSILTKTVEIYLKNQNMFDIAFTKLEKHHDTANQKE